MKYLQFAIYTLLYLIIPVCSLKWISLMHAGSNVTWTKFTHCSVHRRTFGLTVTQTRYCKDNYEFMKVVVQAAKMTAKICKHSFKKSRWDCSSIDNAPKYKNDLKRASKEQAYLIAMSSAVLAHHVTKSCARGVSTTCSCGENPVNTNAGPKQLQGDNSINSQFEWGGCPSDTKFALHFVEQFVNTDYIKRVKMASKRPRLALRDLVRLHNSKLGQKITLENRLKKCNCHGVSGSCAVRTCWMSTPSLKSIKQLLKIRYSDAKFIFQNKLNQKTYSTRNKVTAILRNAKKIGVNDIFSTKNKRSVNIGELAYTELSPDFCRKDKHSGSLGTKGRECVLEEGKENQCSDMCCGRGYRTAMVSGTENCHCRYVHCCRIVCKSCKIIKRRLTCR